MNTPNLFFIVFLFSQIPCQINRFSDIALANNDIYLSVLVKSQKQEIDSAYRNLFKKHLNYNINSLESPSETLKEIHGLRANDLNTPVENLDESSLVTIVRNLLVQDVYEIEKLSDKMKADFSDLAKNYVIREVQDKIVAILKKEEHSNQIDVKFTTEVFQKGLEEFRASRPELLSAEKSQQVLDFIVKSFNSGVQNSQSFVEGFLEFKKNAYKNRNLILNKCLDHVINNVKFSDIGITKEATMAVNKLMAIVEFITKISPPEQNFEIPYSLGKKLTQTNMVFVQKNQVFARILTSKLLKLFSRTTRLDHIRQGKEIFVSYFSDYANYHQPTHAYEEFISKRYRVSGIRFELGQITGKYERMLRLQIVDTVHASIFMKSELLSSEDLSQIFNSFESFSDNFIIDEHVHFIALRQLLINSDESLNDLPNLFNSLYDAILHSTEYHTYGLHLGSFSTNKPAVIFDSYLDDIWKWKHKYKIGYVLKWEPNVEHFSVNIAENYVFFKLINLVNNYKDLKKNGVKFVDYQYRNNYWIHKYTITSEARRFLSYSITQLFPDKGFNYKMFTNAQLSKSFLADYEKYVQDETAEV